MLSNASPSSIGNVVKGQRGCTLGIFSEHKGVGFCMAKSIWQSHYHKGVGLCMVNYLLSQSCGFVRGRINYCHKEAQAHNHAQCLTSLQLLWFAV